MLNKCSNQSLTKHCTIPHKIEANFARQRSNFTGELFSVKDNYLLNACTDSFDSLFQILYLNQFALTMSPIDSAPHNKW